jgi:hypothetical protein
MYLPGTKIKEIKIVSLFGIAAAIAKGDKSVERLVFDEVRESTYGNQEFSNDSIFIYTVSNYAEDRDSIQELIYNYCNELEIIESDDEFGLIYFAVCW